MSKKITACRESSRILTCLQESLGIEITENTNEDVDFHVYRSQSSERPADAEYSKNWLICQFSPLMLKIAKLKVFHKTNSYTGKKCSYFVKAAKREDTEDLVQELISKFPEFVAMYNWTTLFNSWIKDKLEWAAFNFHSKNKKLAEREITSLDAPIGNQDDDDGCQTNKNQTCFERGLWHTVTDQREQAHNNHLISKVINFVEATFPPKKKEIFYLYFDKDMSIKDSMSGVAIKCKHGYHSTVSNVIREIREAIMEFLSKEDEIFDERYQAYMENKLEYRIEMNGPARIIDIDDDIFDTSGMSLQLESFEWKSESTHVVIRATVIEDSWPEDNTENEEEGECGIISVPLNNVMVAKEEPISQDSFDGVFEIGKFNLPLFDLEFENDRTEAIRH